MAKKIEADPITTDGQLGSALLTLTFSVSTVAALLYFLGRSRVQSMQVMLGMPVGIIDSSPIDYAAAGVDVILPFLTSGAIALLLAVATHRMIVQPALTKPKYDRTHRIVRRALASTTALSYLGLALVAIGLIVEDTLNHSFGIILPVTLTASASGLAYSRTMLRNCSDRSRGPLFRLPTGLAVAGILWSGALYGDTTGRKFAEYFEANAINEAEVTIMSHDRLQLVGPGVTVEELPFAENTNYRYCYRGLRFLMSSDRFYVLVPAGFEIGSKLFYVPTTTDVRIETQRATDETSKAIMCSEG